jgi:hypothetical protein
MAFADQFEKLIDRDPVLAKLTDNVCRHHRASKYRPSPRRRVARSVRREYARWMSRLNILKVLPSDLSVQPPRKQAHVSRHDYVDEQGDDCGVGKQLPEIK